MSDTQSSTGGTWGGPEGFTWGGEHGLVWPSSGDDSRPPTPPRGGTWGGPEGFTWGGYHGATWGIEKSADQLLAATDSWGLVIEPVPARDRVGEKRLYTISGDEPDADGSIIDFEATEEALAKASLDVTLAADPDQFRFPFGTFVLGLGGDRRLSGQVGEPDADLDSQEVTLTGLGPLDRLTNHTADVQYAGMAGWEALREFAADEITPATDGEIRVVVVPPEPVQGERESMIPPDSPQEFSGNLLQILSELCGYGGMVWSVDYSERGPGVLVEVFTPGSQLGAARWTATGVSPSLDKGDYASDVIIHGATKPGVGESNVQDADRYRGEASAPDGEVRAITGGERIVVEQTKDKLESDTACREFARSLLDERRGTYQIAGDLDTAAGIVGDLRPGHVYRVPELDDAAPAILSPVVLPLTKASYSYAAGAAERSLSFGPADDPVLGTPLAAEDPPLALRGVSRLDGSGMDGTPSRNNAYAANYSHAYPGANQP